jgi:ADP-ribose pyrophosphatase YjhB (NUDIX family)
VSLLVEREGQILLVRRAIDPGRGQWSLPSGFVEWDESPEVAAARECAEETGLILSDLELLGVSHYTDDFRGPGISLFYQGCVASGALLPGDDAAEARFFARAKLPSADEFAFQGHRSWLDSWFQRNVRNSDSV